MEYCDWCQVQTDKLHKVESLGNTYHVCNRCYAASINEVCILCGEPVVGQMCIKGMCYACSQLEYAERQRKEEELANGVAQELLEAYSNGVEFTEEDFQHWMTFGQGNFTPEKLKQSRLNWLRKKLIEQGGWSTELVEDNLDIIETLMTKYLSKVMDRKYLLVYYDSKNTKQRIRQFVDHIGNIFLIEKK